MRGVVDASKNFNGWIGNSSRNQRGGAGVGGGRDHLVLSAIYYSMLSASACASVDELNYHAMVMIVVLFIFCTTLLRNYGYLE